MHVQTCRHTHTHTHKRRHTQTHKIYTGTHTHALALAQVHCRHLRLPQQPNFSPWLMVLGVQCKGKSCWRCLFVCLIRGDNKLNKAATLQSYKTRV